MVESSCIYNLPLSKARVLNLTAEERSDSLPPSDFRNSNSNSTSSNVTPTPPTYGARPLPIDIEGHNSFEINMLHMELVSHFLLNTCKTLFADPQSIDIYSRAVMASAMAHSFMMHEMLALAAIHLDVLGHDSQKKYRKTSRIYQAKALSHLDEIVHHLDAENCLAVLLFSHQVGIHSFIEAFDTFSEMSFGSFLDKLVDSINLMRGISSIMMPWRDELTKTEVNNLLQSGHNQDSEPDPRNQLDTPKSLIEQAELVAEQRNTYKDTIAKLQWQFDREHLISEAQRATPNTVFAWLITATPHFLQLLREQRPESLVLLAYYAVILHHRRSCWIIGDAGKYLLNRTVCHLGRHWEPWLSWPKSQILAE